MQKETSIALGFFDGVHEAHKNIILSAVRKARESSLCCMVLAFDKSPREILSPGEISYITTADEKRRICESFGARLHLLKTEEELLCKEPEDFVKEYLVQKYKARHISCGYNYRFGKNGRGDAQLLIKLGEEYGFSVEVVPCIMIDGKAVSSSRIRKLMAEGEIEKANKLLGRRFSVTGEVVEGKHLAQRLGFPTANVLIKEKMLSPKRGVYKTVTVIDGREYASVTNVGVNPTVGSEPLRTETYIEGCNENLYGREIRIEFVSFLREEKKFGDIEALKEQMSSDIRHILGKNI